MTRTFRIVATAALLVLAATTSLRAHDFWIEPRAFTVTPGGLVGLRLMVGQDMLGDALARDEAGLDAVAHRVGDVGRVAEAAEGGLIGVPGDALRHEHRARRDAADAHAVTAPGQGEALEQVDLGGLGRGVRREVRPRLEAGDVGDGDDHPAAALLHHPVGRLRREHEPLRGGVHRRVPQRLVDVLRRVRLEPA